MKDEYRYKIEKYVEELEIEYNEMAVYIGYLSMSDVDTEIVKDAMSLIKKRIKKLKKADEKEIKKLLNYKKL